MNHRVRSEVPRPVAEETPVVVNAVAGRFRSLTAVALSPKVELRSVELDEPDTLVVLEHDGVAVCDLVDWVDRWLGGRGGDEDERRQGDGSGLLGAGHDGRVSCCLSSASSVSIRASVAFISSLCESV